MKQVTHKTVNFLCNWLSVLYDCITHTETCSSQQIKSVLDDSQYWTYPLTGIPDTKVRTKSQCLL